MHAGQYKRIYNVVFALLVLCTVVFVFRVSKDLITTLIYKAERSQQQKEMVLNQRRSYTDLVKEGKVEEAEEGNRLLIKHLAVNRRIDSCKDNLGLLSAIATLLLYTGTYFLLWFTATLIVRYIRKAPNASPL